MSMDPLEPRRDPLNADPRPYPDSGDGNWSLLGLLLIGGVVLVLMLFVFNGPRTGEQVAQTPAATDSTTTAPAQPRLVPAPRRTDPGENTGLAPTGQSNP